ncbi:hypothetical protein ASE61_15050 [Bosea sp. Root670]|uniref:hypothetical protein n=1 Tax=Bosea sp. Root670 TaxID=1736583 RepID=UPI000714F980|nr:hypothetical protein [Bosea sp. Root670]KRE02592.1 hypothetical protein ASE61_15050 [Bosea sp. Root670]
MARIAVITAPQPVMSAVQVRAGMPALAGVDEGVLDALIAAATEELDGPTGWLGRSIGLQTLELRLGAFPCGPIRLPLPPVIEVVSITYTGSGGSNVVMPTTDYDLVGDCIAPKSGWPAGCYIRVRYKAGYDETPSRIKVAVQLRVGELNGQMVHDGLLKKEVVEGVGSFEYDLGGSSQRSATSRAVEALLAGLRVWTI